MSFEPENKPLLDATIRIDGLPATGRHINVAAEDAQREALATLLDISSVESLKASLDVTPFRGGIRVLGRLQADIVQPCVVTFEPVSQAIDEPIDRVFLPETGKAAKVTPGAEVFVDLEDDTPDYFDGPEADLTDLIIETLSLAIDPYPRAKGASLDTLGIKVDDGPLSPFSGLKTLKDPGDKH